MDDKFKNIVLGYLSKTLGISEDEAAELLFTKSEDDKLEIKDDALKTLLAKDKDRVTTIKTAAAGNKTEIYDEAYADAKKKVLAKEEKKLAKKYGIEGDDFKLDTLVADIIAKETESGGGGKELTEDRIKKSSTYLALERAKKEELDALKNTHLEEVKTIRADYLRTETVGKVKKSVLSYFDELNPILSGDPTKANNQRENFATRFTNNYNYELQENGEPLVLDKEGKRVEDGHGNAKSLKDLVKEDANLYYDFKVQDPKGGAGNKNGDRGGSIDVPKDKDAYTEAMLNAKTADERATIKAAYDEANA